MKKLIISFLSFAFVTVLVAQTDTADYYSPSKQKISAKDRVSASISMGAGISFLNTSNNNAFTTFVAPKIGYQLTPKFKLNLGVMHYSVTGNTFMPLNQNETLFNSSKKTISGNLLFVEGQYKLNKKLILSGAILYDANGLNNKQNNYKTASFGLDYKVTEHSSIGFRANISQGQDYYYINPKTGKFDYISNYQFSGGVLSPIAAWGVDALNSAIK